MKAPQKKLLLSVFIFIVLFVWLPFSVQQFFFQILVLMMYLEFGQQILKW